MLLNAGHAELRLADDEVARLDEACESRLLVREGNVWITVDGEHLDVVLSPGETWTVDRPGPVMMSALRGPASVSVVGRPDARPRGGPGRGRWRSWLASVSLSSVSVA